MPTSSIEKMKIGTINLERKAPMKKLIASGIACCALIAPLAFAKDQNANNNKQVRAWHFAFLTERPITITAPPPNAKVSGGVAAGYQPANTLVVHQDGPGRY